MFKIIGIILFILYETFDLFSHGIVDHPLAFGMLKIIFLNMVLLLIVIFKNNIFLKMKEKIPPIIKTAAKILLTPIKTPEKK